MTVPFPAQSLQATVWFRTPVRFGARANSAYLRLGSDGRFAQITFKPSVGYRARCRSPKFDLETPPLQPHGDEWEVWHALTIAYNSEKRLIRGYVDERLLLGCDLELDEIVIGFGALTTRSGSRIDIRFDDLAVQPLTSVFNMGVPVAPPEEEPRWDRDPWLGPDDPLVPGEIVERRAPYGDYFEYVPHNVVEPALVAIVSHGSYGDDKMTRELSRVSARRSIHQRGWLLLADTTGLIVVAPSFDYWRFYGYRFLKGSPIGADEFIFRIVDSYRDHFDAVDDRIILVGHSAGAQFAQRFLLAYPHRIFAAVLSSAGTYTFPDETVDWPYGRRNSPNPDGFLEATMLPVRVVMGSQDMMDRTGDGVAQHGVTRVDRADAWVDAMRQFAYDNGLEPRIHLAVIPGAGHSAWALDVNGAWWLAGIIDADRAERQPRGTVPGFPDMRPPS